MTIEYVPRSGPREGGSWRTAVGSADVPAPRHDEVDGRGAVRVPVVPRPVTLPAFRWWFFVIVVINGGNILRGMRNAWSTVGVSFWLTLGVSIVVLAVVYRALRLRRFTGRNHLDVLLSSAGIHTGGLLVPWSQVTGVVRFGFAFGPGRGGPGPRSFVAVRVDDFVAVRGMTPVRAGLANLTRRHLLVLCESLEVHEPTALANALDELVENPPARELLSGVEGERLVATGPSWRVSRP